MKTLISEALVNSRGLRMATLRVQKTRAQYRLTDADRCLQLNSKGSDSWSDNLRGNTATTRKLSTSLDASFDLDSLSCLENMSEAERQDHLATEEAQHAVYILLVSNVAQGYFNQQLAYMQLQVAEETLRNCQQPYASVERQLLAGNSNVLALEQARGVIENTHSNIAKRQEELAQASNALRLLLGSYGRLPQAQTVNSNSLQSVRLPAGLSSQILSQRPDIMKTEYALMAASANIGAARVIFFPSISLTSGTSTASSDLSSLFSTSNGMWNFMPKIEIPIFNTGRNQANLDTAEIHQQQSVMNREQKVRNAFRGVADVLTLRQGLNGQISAQQRYLALPQITLQRAQALYQHGVVGCLEVLDAERSLFAARQTSLNLDYARQVNEISLYATLGGGWRQ